MSIYLHKNAGLFLHIPKCGGKFVRRTLETHGIAHKKADLYDGLHEGWYTKRLPSHPIFSQVKSYKEIDYIFTFIRHPISYYECLWRSYIGGPSKRKRGEKPMPGLSLACTWHPHIFIEEGLRHSETFEEFIDICIEYYPSFVTQLYLLYICNADYVGKLENLAEDMSKIMGHFGYNIGTDEIEKIRRPGTGKGELPRWNPAQKLMIEESESYIINKYYS